MSEETRTDVQENKKFQEINCEESMDISMVANFRSQFIQALESGQPVVLDASQVERADTAALQLLSAFFHDANAQQQSVEWKSPSEILCRSADLLGLSQLLGLEAGLDSVH